MFPVESRVSIWSIWVNPFPQFATPFLCSASFAHYTLLSPVSLIQPLVQGHKNLGISTDASGHLAGALGLRTTPVRFLLPP